MPTIDAIREQFPALGVSSDVLMDNAGGSQVPRCVADAMHSYMLNSYVQLGADYATSKVCTEVVERAHTTIETFLGAGDAGVVTLGPSTTALCNMLAWAYGERRAGDRTEIVIAESAHEANAGAWERLGKHGFEIRLWPVNVETMRQEISDLTPLLSERTLLVTFPWVSNLFGGIEDAKKFIEAAHGVGARVVVDGVAYAPHRAIDMQALGADWLVYSTYKVFGPHMAALYGTHEAYAEIEGPNHYFIDGHDVPYKMEPGGASHEGCAGLVALGAYLSFLADEDANAELTHGTVERAFDLITERETALQRQFMDGVAEIEGVRFVGPKGSDAASRVSTVSFAHEHLRSADIVRSVNAKGFGIRYGHFYAHRLSTRLTEAGVLHDVDDGVVRTSLLHYNTEDEVARLVDCLGSVVSARV